jgi:hypothetical protein
MYGVLAVARHGAWDGIAVADALPKAGKLMVIKGEGEGGFTSVLLVSLTDPEPDWQGLEAVKRAATNSDGAREEKSPAPSNTIP